MLCLRLVVHVFLSSFPGCPFANVCYLSYLGSPSYFPIAIIFTFLLLSCSMIKCLLFWFMISFRFSSTSIFSVPYLSSPLHFPHIYFCILFSFFSLFCDSVSSYFCLRFSFIFFSVCILYFLASYL